MDHFREAEKLIEQADTYAKPDLRTTALLGAIAHGIAGVLEALQHAPIGLTETSIRVPLLKVPMRKDTEVSP